MNLLQKSNAHLNLTPGERALLKLGESFILAGLVAALPLVTDALSRQNVNWNTEVPIIVSAFSVAVIAALTKYVREHADPPLPTPPTP